MLVSTSTWRRSKVISHGRSIAFQMAEVAIPRHMFQETFAADRRAATEATACISMRRPMLMRLEATDGRTAPRCRGKIDNSDPRTPLRNRIVGERLQTVAGLLNSPEIRYCPRQI